MDIKKLQSTVIDALENIKAQDIRVYDTVHLTSLFDRIAIASGTSNRQTKALAASVREKVKESGGTVLSVEGEDTGEWVLVDLGDMIVHIMQPAIRAYYRLEEIWGDKEVKLGAAKRAPKHALESPEGEVPPKKASRHLTITQSPSDEAPKKRVSRKAAPATKEKAAPAKRAAPKTAAVKKAAPKPAVIKKTVPKAATVKVASKTAATKKPAAGKPKAGTTKALAPKKTPAKRTVAKTAQ